MAICLQAKSSDYLNHQKGREKKKRGDNGSNNFLLRTHESLVMAINNNDPTNWGDLSFLQLLADSTNTVLTRLKHVVV